MKQRIFHSNIVRHIQITSLCHTLHDSQYDPHVLNLTGNGMEGEE